MKTCPVSLFILTSCFRTYVPSSLEVHVNITIDEDLNQWLEKAAADLRMNKSQLINNLILMGKDDVGVMKGTGVLGAAKVIRQLEEEILKMQRKGVGVEAGE